MTLEIRVPRRHMYLSSSPNCATLSTQKGCFRLRVITGETGLALRDTLICFCFEVHSPSISNPSMDHYKVCICRWHPACVLSVSFRLFGIYLFI